MSEYRVVWVIDVEADSPREAAEAAQSFQRDPKSTANVFTVRLVRQRDAYSIVAGDADTIDLDEDEA